MKIGINGAVAAIIRQGDYFVTVASPQGVGFEYAPDGGPGAPVVGAVVARKGSAIFLNAHEAGELVSRYGSEAEDELVLRLELPGSARGIAAAKERLIDRLERTIRLRSALEDPGSEFIGTAQDLYSAVLLPGGILEPFNSTLRRALSTLPTRIPGFLSLGKTSHRMFQIHWGIVADSNPTV